MTRHTITWKKKQLEELKQLADSHPVIAIANIKNFPAPLFQQLRKKLHGKAVAKVCKTRVAKKALEQSKIEAKELTPYLNESIAIIFSSMGPFELYYLLKQSKGKVAAKPGMVAPNDIVVPAGDTGLPPGPALSDLKAAGLNVRVQGPTIHVAEDKVVVKKGETVSTAVAATLAKLDIKPISVGLNVIACYEDKQVFEASVLDIDREKVKEKLSLAYKQAFNLAFNAGLFLKETTPPLLQKAFTEAKAIALVAGIISPSTINELLALAARQALSIKTVIGKKAEAQTTQASEAQSTESSQGTRDTKDQGPQGSSEREKQEKQANQGQEKTKH